MTFRLIRVFLAAAALLAAALPAAAQGGDTLPEHGMRRGGPPGPPHAFQQLLRRRAELGLTDDQVRRLEVIGAHLEAANAPLRRRLADEREALLSRRRAELERMTPAQRRAEFRRMRRGGRPPLPPGMESVADQMRRNIVTAMREAHGVLTAEQRARVREMVQGARERRGIGGRHRGGMGRPRP